MLSEEKRSTRQVSSSAVVYVCPSDFRPSRAKIVPRATPDLFARLAKTEAALAALSRRLNGDPIRSRFNEARMPGILGRASRVAGGHWNTRQTPTATQRQGVRTAREGFSRLRRDLRRLLDVDLRRFEADLSAAGATFTPGRK